MSDNQVRGLRDAILIEADYLDDRAQWIDALVKQPTSQAVLKKRLSVGAAELRNRAKLLHDVLERTEPTGAKAS
jgi:hypothetical protein